MTGCDNPMAVLFTDCTLYPHSGLDLVMADSLRLNQLIKKRLKGTLTETEKDELIMLLITQLKYAPGRIKVRS